MKKGFTLLEAVLSLTILSMIVYLASTSFLNLVPKFKLEKAVWEICSSLNLARYQAQFKGTSLRVRFYSTSYALEKYDESRKSWKLQEKHFLEGVTVEANNAPIFTPEGSVSGLATIYIYNSRGKYKITLAITGRIKSARVN